MRGHAKRARLSTTRCEDGAGRAFDFEGATVVRVRREGGEGLQGLTVRSMERRRRIALYGGTFDPVHVGHTALARRLLELFSLDEVLFIPAHVAPHKRDREVSPALHRYAMLALATQGEERFRVSTVELDAPERPYTVEHADAVRARRRGARRGSSS